MDIGGLAGDVFFAHVDDAFEGGAGADGGGGDAVLAGAGFGDDAGFVQVFGEEDLADGVVDFVGAGVVEVFAFEVDAGAAVVFGEPFGKVDGAGTTDEGAEGFVVFGEEGFVGAVAAVGAVEFFYCGNQGFGDEAAAEFAIVAVGIGAWGFGDGHCFVWCRKARILSQSF